MFETFEDFSHYYLAFAFRNQDNFRFSIPRGMFMKSVTDYRGHPSLLSEKMHSLGEVLSSYLILFERYFGDFWILGTDFYDLSKISSKQGVECGEFSCYEKSSREGKICKQGTF